MHNSSLRQSPIECSEAVAERSSPNHSPPRKRSRYRDLDTSTFTQLSSYIILEEDSHLIDKSLEPLSELALSPARGPPRVVCKVLGKTPLVTTIGKDLKEHPALTLFVEIDSNGTGFQYCKVKFFDNIGEELVHRIYPDDTMKIWGDVNIVDNRETHISAKKRVDSWCSPRHFPRTLIFSMQSPQHCDDNLAPVELRVCYLCSHFMMIDSLSPSQRTHMATQYETPLMLLHSSEENRLWNYPFPCHKQSSSVVPSPCGYSLLSSIALNFENYFYGVITDISKGTRISRLPKIGLVALMNVDIVDPSIVADFKSALIPSNPAKINVMVVAPQPNGIPLIALGDLIRVHRVVIKSHQNPRNFDMFLDCMYDPRISIRIWDSSYFAQEVKNDDPLALQQEIERASQPIWSSQHPTIHVPGHHIEWNDEPRHSSSEHEWNRLRCYAAWVHQSLIGYRCLYNQYITNLYKWVDSDISYKDIIVKIIDIEDSREQFCQPYRNEVFSTLDSSSHSQSQQIASSNFVAQTGLRLHSLSHNPGDTSLRLRVVDEGSHLDNSKQHESHLDCHEKLSRTSRGDHDTSRETTSDRQLLHSPSDGSELDDIWILTNFSCHSVPQLRLLQVGNWLRVRNAEYKGPQRLIGKTKFLPPNRYEWEFLFVDCFRARIIRIPDSYFEESKSL